MQPDSISLYVLAALCPLLLLALFICLSAYLFLLELHFELSAFDLMQ